MGAQDITPAERATRFFSETKDYTDGPDVDMLKDLTQKAHNAAIESAIRACKFVWEDAVKHVPPPGCDYIKAIRSLKV